MLVGSRIQYSAAWPLQLPMLSPSSDSMLLISSVIHSEVESSRMGRRRNSMMAAIGTVIVSRSHAMRGDPRSTVTYVN